MSIVNSIKENQKITSIKSVVLMDPGNSSGFDNYPFPPQNFPTMIIWSAYFKDKFKAHFNLGSANYEMILTKNKEDTTYSNHGDFFDAATLLEQEAYQISKVQAFLKKPENEALGKGKGFEISTSLNHAIEKFFNHYDKKISQKNCKTVLLRRIMLY
ncbi:hypothetical protein [Silvanigrella aquatica]|nr:hypothetical protein [Silvanigrella aquatica]